MFIFIKCMSITKKPKFISEIVLYYLLCLYLLFMILEFQLRGGGGGCSLIRPTPGVPMDSSVWIYISLS